MTRSELIAKLAAKNPALYHRDIERLVSTILDEIGGALERGDRVELRGFGAFWRVQGEWWAGRRGRTPLEREGGRAWRPFARKCFRSRRSTPCTWWPRSWRSRCWSRRATACGRARRPGRGRGHARRCLRAHRQSGKRQRLGVIVFIWKSLRNRRLEGWCKGRRGGLKDRD